MNIYEKNINNLSKLNIKKTVSFTNGFSFNKHDNIMIIKMNVEIRELQLKR